MKKFNQFMSEAKGYGDVNRQVASAQDKVDRAQAKNVTTKGKKLGVLADPYSGKPTKQEVWEYKGKKWLVLGKSVEVFVPMKYHKVIKEDIEQIDEVTKAEVKQLTTKLNSLKRKGFKVHIGDQPKWFWATANKMKADKSHKAEVDAIIKAFKAKLDYSMPGDERGDFIKRYKTASGIEIEFERATEYDKTKTLSVSVSTDIISEDIANAAGGALGSNPSTGSIAGYDPMLSKKPLKRSKFAGTECFEVDNDTFQKCHTGHGKYERWDKYLKDDCDTCKNIRAYAKRHPQKDIVIQRAGCGTMTYLKRKGVHY
jgi:hypothetical protein